jgi:hypothetical protein
MASDQVLIAILEGEDVIARWRNMMGATDPRRAAPGTIRARWGNQDGVIYRNVVHGSDSVTSARREIACFFSSADGTDDLTVACCNSCYNSHGSCIEHGSCLCHAKTTGHMSFGDLAKAERAMEIIDAGQSYQVEGGGAVIDRGMVEFRYPEGRAVDRRATVARQATVIVVQFLER